MAKGPNARLPFAIILAALLALCLSACQTKPSPAPASASSPGPGSILSPEVHADRTVTLRLYFPGAKAVIASGDFGDLPMTKDTAALWSITTAVLQPAIYRYTFVVDGARRADPNNPDIKGTAESLVTVPGDPPRPWEFRDVAHGRVIQVLYRSAAFEATRRFYVYTPPSFDTSSGELPALYLLHGYTDDDSSWTAVGKAGLIADNLIAEGAIEPLLIVMPYGQQDSRVTDREALAPKFQEKYRRQILTEIIPYVEKNYRAAPDARSRAIAGVSMGGMQAAYIGMNHPEVFSTVGVWSAAFFGDPSVLFSGLLAASEDQRRSFRLVRIGVGQEDPLLFCSRTIDHFLSTRGIAHEFAPTAGGHSWVVWRGYLVDFLTAFSAVSR